MWRLSLHSDIKAPLPENHGWVIEPSSSSSETAELSVKWCNIPVAPEDLMETTSCSCKRSNCAKGNCSCVKNNLRCSAVCNCTNCKNVPETDDLSDEDTGEFEEDDSVRYD